MGSCLSSTFCCCCKDRPDESKTGGAAMTTLDSNTANATSTGVQQSGASQALQSPQLAVPPPNLTHQSSHGSFQAQLQAFGDRVKKIPVLPHKQGDVKGVDYVYGIDKGFDGRIQLFKYGVGPLELDISYDHHTKGIVVDIYLVAPFVSKIKIGTVSGSLVEGLTAKLGYGTSLVGHLSIQKVANEAIMSFNFTAFDKEYKGTVKLFSV